MADMNIQIQDVAGNNLFPKTLGKLVFNNNNESLGTVEAGAQVNVVETVKFNGQALTPDANKAVDIVLPAAAEYEIRKADTADEGMAATYQLFKDNTAVGDKINVPKDLVVSGGELKFCTEKGQPVASLEVGDPYIDLTIANKDNTHVYIPVKDLVDVYTAGNGITIEGNVVAIDDTVVVNHTEFDTELAKKQNNLSEAQLKAVDSGIDSDLVAKYDGYEATINGKQDQLTAAQLEAVNSGITAAKFNAYETHLADADIHVTTADKAEWSGKQDALDADQLAAVNSGITDTKVATYDGYAATIADKADKATTLAGYGITDGLTYVEINDDGTPKAPQA